MKRIALGAIPPRTDTPSGACCKGIKGLFRRHLTRAGNQFLGISTTRAPRRSATRLVPLPPGGRQCLMASLSAGGGRGSRLMAVTIPLQPTRPHPHMPTWQGGTFDNVASRDTR